MCGIISYFSNEVAYDRKIAQLMTSAFWIGSVRGVHSTGMIYEEDGNPEYYKKALAGWDFIQLNRVNNVLDNLHETGYFIGHNRAATRGAHTTQNAHPFEHGNIIGVHNGTLINQHAVSTTTHTVDSDALFKGISEAGTVITMPKVNGAFNLLWHDNTNNTVHVLRNDERPYTLAKIKGQETLIGMSEEPMLRWLAGKYGLEIEYTWVPKPNREYIFDVNGDMTKPVTKIDHQAYVAPVYVAPVYPKAVVYRGPQNKGLSVVSPKKVIEFLADSVTVESYLVNKKKVGTWYGETEDGESVVVRCVPEDEMESGEWYEGEAEHLGNVWIVDIRTVQSSPLYPSSINTPAIVYCEACYQTFDEQDTVTVNKETYCLECCTRYAIESHEVDRNHRHRMN
jgi:predicted glutamine amidotransferase